MGGLNYVSDREREAQIIRRGIDFGLYSLAEAVRWSDQTISVEAKPNFAFIELSLASQPQEILGHLDSISGQTDSPAVLAGLFRKMLRSLNADESKAEQLAQTLFRMAHDHEWKSAGLDENDAYRIDDAFDLAASGAYGTRTDAVDELRTFLEEHAADEHFAP